LAVVREALMDSSRPCILGWESSRALPVGNKGGRHELNISRLEAGFYLKAFLALVIFNPYPLFSLLQMRKKL
jgi:hypothetical protein